MTVTLDSLKGRIGDLDSHESIPVPRYPEVFGEVGDRFLKENEGLWKLADQIHEQIGGQPGDVITVDRADDAEINHKNVWELKGVLAPGAVDMDRRPAAMDAMGIERQLIFPMMGVFAWIQALGGGQIWIPPATKEQIEGGRLAVDAYNRWAGTQTKKSDRMRMVGLLLSGHPEMTPELLIKETEKLIGLGIKAIQISAGEPPAGLSPADRRLDPFYELLAQNNVALVFHPPSGLGFRKSEVWEQGLMDPRFGGVTTQHLAEENFCAILVLGGVFQRHPTLRIAFVEAGADWIGPLAERMDYGVVQHVNPLDSLEMMPSEFMARNVRAAVMNDEPVHLWLDRYPALHSCYCYSSDFPHYEGKPYSLQTLFEKVKPFGDDVLEKFFVTNSQWVLPAAR